ncbi:CNNM domain-containing protein, partial [Candidatus Dependentiae bacterium]
MTELVIDLTLFTGTLALAAYFAFLETSFTGLRLYQVKELQQQVVGYKHFFATWKSAPQRILTAILVANNFFSILCSVLIARAMEESLGEWGVAVGVAVATVLILLFGDIVPKTFAKTHHGPLFRGSLWLLNGIIHALSPIVSLLLWAAKMVLSLLGVENFGKSAVGDVSEKEIEFLIGYGDEKGFIETEKSELLQNVFGLGETIVQEIMVPWTDVVRFEVEKSIDDAKQLLVKHRYSRLPVYKDKEDNIVGMVYHKDIFAVASDDKKKVADLVRPVMFIPETKKANQLLKEFLKKRMHLSVVVDEHGSVA